MSHFVLVRPKTVFKILTCMSAAHVTLGRFVSISSSDLTMVAAGVEILKDR